MPEHKANLSEFDSLTDEEIHEAIMKDPDAAPELDEVTIAAFRPAEEVLPHSLLIVPCVVQWGEQVENTTSLKPFSMPTTWPR